jgi:pyruvate dehydrogenase E1 component alpha subunit
MTLTHDQRAGAPATMLKLIGADGARVADAPYPAELDVAQLWRLLAAMRLTRRLDQELINLQRQGQLALYPSCRGQEAAQVGTAVALRPDDWTFPQYRELGVFVVKGIDPAGVGHMWRGTAHGGLGFVERCCAPITIPIAAHTLHAVGYALGLRLNGSDGVVAAYVGDGGTSKGDFHEALNMAAVMQVPCIFVVQNNQWAISVPLAEQTRVTRLADKAAAYGMPGIRCDGNDVLACLAAMQQAVDRARRGLGPSLIEAVTYRMGAHTTSDDPTRYRSDSEVAEWARRDPIERFERHLVLEGKWSPEDDLRSREAGEEAARRLRAALFDAPAPDPLVVFDHVVSEVSPALEEQRRQLAAELAGR